MRDGQLMADVNFTRLPALTTVCTACLCLNGYIVPGVSFVMAECSKSLQLSYFTNLNISLKLKRIESQSYSLVQQSA